jgi:hypothetical protein
MVHRTVRCTPDMSGATATSPGRYGSDRWSSDCWARLDVRWRTGHALWSVRCASMGVPDFCARWRAFNALQVAIGAWSSRCFVVTPDSPVYTGHVRWIIVDYPFRIPEADEFRVSSSLGHRTLSGVHWTVQWIIARRLWEFPKVRSSAWSPLVHRTLSGAPDQGAFGCPFAPLFEPFSLDLFIGLLWTFGTCRSYRLGQTS